MRQIFKGLLYLILIALALWFSCILFSTLIVFSYTNNILSWIPYIILGCWVPGKIYGLNLLHSIICISISFGIINFFDKKLSLSDFVRKIVLLIIIFMFSYETITNYFYRGEIELEIYKFKQFALIQLSFIIGIIIKTINKDANTN